MDEAGNPDELAVTSCSPLFSEGVKPASDSEDGGSSTSSESSEADAAEAENAKKDFDSQLDPNSVAQGLYVFHTTFTTVHRLRAAQSDRMACGRIFRTGFKKLDHRMLSKDWPRCRMCFP